jgi:lipopolysaccharide export system protein LptA
MIFVLSVFVLVCQLWGQKYIEPKPVPKPLIMRHADSLAGNKQRGEYILIGDVQFQHDSLWVFTERAEWNRNRDIVKGSGGFQIFHPQGKMRANTGTYDRRNNKAVAQGNVVVRDSSGELGMFGERIVYDRNRQIVDMYIEPIIHRYYPPDAKQKKAAHPGDTLIIRAKHMQYNDSLQIARANDSVHVTRGNLTVTSDSGVFKRDSNVLYLYGTPFCKLDDYTLTGDFMKIELEQERLKSVLVVANAVGTQRAPKQNNAPANYAEVHGDTLWAEFTGDKMKIMRASSSIGNHAEGFFLEEDLQDFKNKMAGNVIEIGFDKKGQMKIAQVMGKAKSEYWYVTEKRSVEGRNEAQGDTIFVRFTENQIKELEILGNVASGVFYGEAKDE